MKGWVRLFLWLVLCAGCGWGLVTSLRLLPTSDQARVTVSLVVVCVTLLLLSTQVEPTSKGEK